MGFRKELRKSWKKFNLLTFLRSFFFEAILIIMSVWGGIAAEKYFNNRSKKKDIDKILLTELRSNLENNRLNISCNIRNEGYSNNEANKILKFLNDKSVDSIGLKFQRIGWLEKIELETSGYYALKSLGLSNIDNDSLRMKIIHLYEVEYPKLIERTFNTSMSRSDIMLPEIYKRFSYDLITGDYIPNNYAKLSEDVKFKNLVSFSIELKQWRMREKNNSLCETFETIKFINKELGVKDYEWKSCVNCNQYINKLEKTY